MKRRTVLTGMAAAASALALGRAQGNSNVADAGPAAVQGCSLITQDITGPYFLDARQVRSDIAEGLPGLPLQLDFIVTNQFSCKPLPGAHVHIWHCDAAGRYSGVINTLLDMNDRPSGEIIDLTDSFFLRGMQTSDAEGRVRFLTIVPGWYAPRPTHLHLKVYPPTPGEVATTQLYFPPAFCNEAYKHEAYAARGPSPNQNDHRTYAADSSADEAELWITPVTVGTGYQHTMELGVTFYGTDFGNLGKFYDQG